MPSVVIAALKDKNYRNLRATLTTMKNIIERDGYDKKSSKNQMEKIGLMLSLEDDGITNFILGNEDYLFLKNLEFSTSAKSETTEDESNQHESE